MLIRLLVLLSVCGGGLLPLAAQAQDAERTYALVMRGAPLGEALDHLVRTAQIDLVYTSDLIAGKRVYCTRREATAEELLRCVLQATGLDYVQSSSGAYVLILALEQPPQRGALAGVVVDRETGAPLPYASVLLADASAGTAADAAGLFSFAGVVAGPHRVVVSYLGYETTLDSVWVEPGAARRVQVGLQPEHIVIEPLLVDGLVQRLPSGGLGHGGLGDEELSTLRGPGTPDIARSAGRLPGVAVQQPLADLHIQGSDSGEHLTLLDGTPVRNPVSLGRHLGAFSPLALRRLTVHKAGFGAEHGSHLGGVIQVEHDLNAARTPGLALSVDPVSASGRVQHRWQWGGGGQATVLAALRSSVWPVYRDAGVQSLLTSWNAIDPLMGSLWLGDAVSEASLTRYRQTPDVAFSDAHLAARVQLSPFHIVTASGYRGGNHLAAEQTAVHTASPDRADQLLLTDDVYDWLNWAGHVGYHRLLGDRAIATLTARGSWHTSSYVYHALRAADTDLDDPTRREALEADLRPTLADAPGSAERNHIRELSVEAALSTSLAPDRHLEAGLRLEHTASDFEAANAFVAPFTYRAATWQGAGYATGAFNLGLAVLVEPSLRLTWVPRRQTVYAEPRLAVRYDRPWQRAGSVAVRLAGGVYRQFVGQYELSSVGTTAVVPSIRFWLPVDETLAPPRAYHLTAEARLAPTPQWTIEAETYAKLQPRLLGLDYRALVQEYPALRPSPAAAALTQDAFLYAQRGRAYGGSVRVRWAGPRLTPTLAYSYSQAERRYPGRFEGAYVPVPWNEPHRVTADATLHLRPALALTAAWTGRWGRRWGLRQMYYDYLRFSNRTPALDPFRLENPAAHRLPPVHTLDLGVAITQAGRYGTVQVRAFVLNALDRANVFDRSLETASDRALQPLDRLMPGRRFAFSVRVER